MVELPTGKLKSREGTAVDADDLMAQMLDTAREMADELGKLKDFSREEKEEVVRRVGLGALKYYILKVDPQKSMLFNPKESIDFNGNTGPFVQYTYARIRSVLRRAGEAGTAFRPADLDPRQITLTDKEIALIKLLDDYENVLRQAAAALSPALIANYAYDLAKEYNQFYHDLPILKEENHAHQRLRLVLSAQTAVALQCALGLLGIDVPERM